ncbi:polysaccharide deacetylase family protein [Polaribacter haliotis]|uniref:Polysaccharide deacetylase family protein n=1 Tax=Polaribacter haliotis TaxID=1888915 RepID=A0A7L8AJW6_9FLAO|nr:polysaccharide deacetylase family protein [Polaribacter haliotis]QOD62291.1 polysaccharide deacetylase family protein [Polaribacter haliotis]
MNSILENLLKRMISASDQRLVVPFYHKVSDAKQSFEKDLYIPRKVIDFKNDITVLSTFYNPISMQEFIEISKLKEKPKKNYFHITFDDGLSNFYKIVAPILLEKKIPATVFVNSDFVDNKALFYRYKASLLYQVYEKSSKKEKTKFYDFFEEDKAIREKLFAINFNNKEVLDSLANEIKFSFDEYLQTEKPYLSSAQIEELIAMGFTIGAHSKSHPLYSDISFEAQINQTKECVDWLVKKFHLDYKVFSFPFTDLEVSKEFFTTLMNEKVIEASFGTSGIKKDKFDTNFQRLFFEIGNENAENYLLKEYFKYFLKIPFQKNTMPRN